jgi:hypothetical protein
MWVMSCTSKAGERHWHGAKAETTMGHITITLVGSQAAHG